MTASLETLWPRHARHVCALSASALDGGGAVAIVNGRLLLVLERHTYEALGLKLHFEIENKAAHIIQV